MIPKDATNAKYIVLALVKNLLKFLIKNERMPIKIKSSSLTCHEVATLHYKFFWTLILLSASNARKAEPELLNWDALRDLVSFAQFKKMWEKHKRRSVTFSKNSKVTHLHGCFYNFKLNRC